MCVCVCERERGGGYVVRKIPTGVDKVCERHGDIVRKGTPMCVHVCAVKAVILIYDTVQRSLQRSIQVHIDFYDSRTWVLNCPGRILLISN